jgi:hypothetical protein
MVRGSLTAIWMALPLGGSRTITDLQFLNVMDNSSTSQTEIMPLCLVSSYTKGRGSGRFQHPIRMSHDAKATPDQDSTSRPLQLSPSTTHPVVV